jgi:hypothetical protein
MGSGFIPAAERAQCDTTFRVYRQVDDDPFELIITGTVTRPEPVRWNVRSLVMQAKLCGFRFCLDEGKLVALQVEEK